MRDGHEAADLKAWLEEGGRSALPAIGEELKRRAIELTPPDPQRDPDPALRLRDDFKVRVYGDFVSVSNENPYAVKQHEALQFDHPNGGRAKYLERPANEMAKELAAHFAEAIARERSGRTRRRTLGI